MIARLAGAGLVGLTRTLVGARAQWRVAPPVGQCLYFANHTSHLDTVAIWSALTPRQRAAQLGLSIEVLGVSPHSWPGTPAAAGSLYCWDTPLGAEVRSGQLDANNASYVLETLRRAGQGCIDGDFAAIVTAPVHKGVINEAGVPFSGHTEFFAEQTGTEQVVMMLATRGLRVALVTTHLPLRDVADAVTPERLMRVARILHADLRDKFGIARPRILVCGLNPHNGDGGAFGRDEIDVIEPGVRLAAQQGFPADGCRRGLE